MVEVNLEAYAVALFMLMIVVVVSIIVILYKLRNSDIPLGMVKIYIFYFVAGLCGWIFNGLSNSSEKYLNLTIGGFFYIVCSYLLLIAVSRNRCKPIVHRSVILISFLTLLISVFEESVNNQLLIISIFGFIIYMPVTFFSFKNTLSDRNLGDGMITLAVLASVIISLTQIYLILIVENPSLAYSFGLVNSSAGYLLVGIGFIASMLFREHQILISQAVTDPLTKLLNRRGMEYSLSLIVPKASRNKNCISAVTMDIDHFKKINDSYGHDGGDEVLKKFAQQISQSHRESDICCRLGGEEFVIILPKITSDDAQKIAENLRQNIEKLEIDFNDTQLSVTSSFGVATQCSKINIDELLKQADKALYEAKNSGRNRVCTAVA